MKTEQFKIKEQADLVFEEVHGGFKLVNNRYGVKLENVDINILDLFINHTEKRSLGLR
mgnify:CR=1 FL=1